MGEKVQNQIQHQHEYEHELKHELENEHEIENEGGIWQTPLIRSQATFQNIRFDFDSSSFSLLCLELYFFRLLITLVKYFCLHAAKLKSGVVVFGKPITCPAADFVRCRVRPENQRVSQNSQAPK